MARWARGRDQWSPRGLLGPLVGTAGGAVALLPGAVRWAAEIGAAGLLFWVAALAIVVPAGLLSAVTPVVTTLRLTSLDETGSVVGRLSGIGTLGAIAATVLTGFVLVSVLPVSTILVGLGLLLVVAGVVVDVAVRGWRLLGGPAAFLALGGAAAALAPGGCDVETTYHCVVVEEDPQRPEGRLLVMDGVRHSYVDLGEPTHLEFAYVRALAAAVDATYGPEVPLRAHHLGGGGLTLPRWLDATRPGTRSSVSEIDPGVVEVDRERLGLETGPDLAVRVEDGRVGLRRLADDSRDLVVGDAFGGVSVPFHLTTTEALADVRRVLTPDGAYVANMIDHPPLAFARAEVATLLATFEHVAVAASPEALAGEGAATWSCSAPTGRPTSWPGGPGSTSARRSGRSSAAVGWTRGWVGPRC